MINPDDGFEYIQAPLPNPSEKTFIVPLYKGHNTTFITNSEPTKEGNAEVEHVEDSYYIDITGDCTLIWHEVA
jgi:hypothetical protein